MGIEIERKYIVATDEYKKMSVGSHSIIQGYLSAVPQRTVRVRIYDQQAFLTIKGLTTNLSRQEYEYEIPLQDAREMLEMCEHAPLSKTRYIVEYDGKKWEIDEFHNQLEGLVIAEIELDDSNESFSLPPFVGREVTGDPAYYNSTLSKR